MGRDETGINVVDNILYNNVVQKALGVENVRYRIYPNQLFNQGMQLGLDYDHNQIYKPGITKQLESNKGYNEWVKHAGKSSLGTLILSSFYFSNGIKQFDVYVEDTNGNGQTIPVTTVLQESTKVDTCLFEVNKTKEIVKTKIVGRNGTVKEYIGDSDYNITIKGVIVGKNGIYPTNDVEGLIIYLKEKSQLKIVCPYLNEMFDIKNVVVESYSFEQVEGGFSYQPFTINLSSDDTDYSDILVQKNQ